MEREPSRLIDVKHSFTGWHDHFIQYETPEGSQAYDFTYGVGESPSEHRMTVILVIQEGSEPNCDGVEHLSHVRDEILLEKITGYRNQSFVMAYHCRIYKDLQRVAERAAALSERIPKPEPPRGRFVVIER